MVTGIGELRELQLNLYPNPAIDQLNISSTQTINRITIYNNASQVVYQQEMGGKKSVTLNTLSYKAGIYVIKIDTDNEQITQRLVITKL